MNLHTFNRMHGLIKDFKDAFPDNFEKSGINACGMCGATGLKNRFTLEHCEHCGGLGFTGIIRYKNMYLCKKCHGHGCENCQGNGITDVFRYIAS